MKCPIDGTELKMADRSGVEIDYCPTCRGVWLDRGELDKIIERSAVAAPPPPPPPQATYRDDDHDRRARHDDRFGGFGRKKKKRDSFLDDLFDF